MKVQIVKRDRGINQDLINQLSKDLKATKEVVSLLLNRGYKKEELNKYIQNEEFYKAPFNSIKNIDEAVVLVAEYLEDDNATIDIFADYDSDGINAGYTAYSALTAIKEALESKVTINVYYPNRSEGYGLSMAWCKKNFARKSNKKRLVITVDNGITKKEEVEYLKSKNVAVLITDHHAPKQGETPECLVIDPWLNDLHSKNAKGLCGAAVAYKLCGALLEHYGDDTNFILNYLPNVAIATVTDIMPATQENIGLVGHGLWLLNNGYANYALTHYKNFRNADVGTKELGFEIGPQLNACGRMGAIQKAANFMLCEDEEEIEDVYNEMVLLNDSRKELEKSITEEIFKNKFEGELMIVAHIPHLGGLGGTVASKVVEHYGRPCILLSGDGDVLHGSARTFGGIDLHALFSLEVQMGNLVNFGGHKVAAGVAVKKENLDKLRHSLNQTLAQLVVETGVEAQEDITIEVDNIIDLKDITKNTVKPYEELLCFGDLKEPMFALKDIAVLEARSSSNPNHLCLNLTDATCLATKNRYGKIVGKEIWGWNKMAAYKRAGSPEKVHIIGKIVPDFRNPKFYTFDIVEIIPA